ncbi:MAG: HlyD family secretion protein, partial [Geobacteraceae bacterium]|nr:HlyD family secretion protein [Geobacteraceae bacterium]
MQPIEPASDQEAPPAIPEKAGNGKRKRAGIVILLLVAAGTVMGINWWIKSKTRIGTDNAFVEARIHSISAKVPGTVVSVPVKENQPVRKGELLAELDPGDYRVFLENARAELDMARNETSGDYARVEGARASIDLARARLDQAGLDLQRGKALFAREVIPREQLDRLETSRKVAESQLREKEENLRKEQGRLGLAGNGGKEARVAQKQAKLDEARLNLSYTRIYAPADGYVTRKSVEPGNNLQPGQPLMAVVALDDAWVTANYKESQLSHVREGQRVEFRVDAYPGKKFTGSVESIMAGTGAAFSLLPPENATGNYVKVVQ